MKKVFLAIILFVPLSAFAMTVSTPRNYGDTVTITCGEGSTNYTYDLNNTQVGGWRSCTTQNTVTLNSAGTYAFHDVSAPYGLVSFDVAAPVSGCMDSTALNYNSLATADDGSCTYRPESLVFATSTQDVANTVSTYFDYLLVFLVSVYSSYWLTRRFV